MLLELAPAGLRQGELFDCWGEDQRERREQLMATLDGLNARFGRVTLWFAAEGLGRGWRMRREHLPPAYTTCWASLPVAVLGSLAPGVAYPGRPEVSPWFLFQPLETPLFPE